MADQETSRRIVPFLPRGTVLLWLLLWAVWLVANASLAADVLITGGAISLAIAWLSAARSSAWQGVALTPGTAFHFAVFTAVFFRELVLANINMIRWVYSPRLDMRPGVIRIDTRLKSPIGRLVLANSIALTPGSLVLDVEGDTLLIHWLDVRTTDREQATQMLAGPYERHLEKIFG